ncbi:aminoglycoside phosphotransferase family protein [Bacillus salacetis]|uniref:Aminoglycoside phosphotransferase family protein n=1 Tax=Bacillus salacetis TaxID=2315464 RepID=A0A3A1QZH8_9BACI|nr:aminoglycoside phosphotransferase family protein [Bacillus salacetis]RIW34696.1 aminoglycoside phosphotransferase family protein [Bacillus salacetis]
MNRLIQQETERLIGKILREELLAEQGCTSIVRKLVSVQQCCILKSSFKPKYRDWLKAEAEALKIQQGVSLPKYFGFFEEDVASHLLMSFEEGTTLRKALENARSLEDEVQLIRSFGEFLQHFHQTNNTEAFNNDWLQLQLIRAQGYLAIGEADGTAELLEELKENLPQPVSQTLIHGDCTTDNVLVKDRKVYMFIDAAGMTVGDPRYDEALAIGRFKENNVYLDAFYQGYTRYKLSEEEYCYFDQGLYEFF